MVYVVLKVFTSERYVIYNWRLLTNFCILVPSLINMLNIDIKNNMLNIALTDESCPEKWEPYAGDCYYHRETDVGITWYTAENACQTHGAHLVSVKDRATLKFLHYMLITDWKSSNKDVFIGN